jgi:hypothetical protein
VTFRPFPEAREYVRSLRLKSKSAWYNRYRSGEKRHDIPTRPDVAYKREWISWSDWLGTEFIATHNRTYRPFEEARKFVHSLGLKDRHEWYEYCKSGKKPIDIPSKPGQLFANCFIVIILRIFCIAILNVPCGITI